MKPENFKAGLVGIFIAAVAGIQYGTSEWMKADYLEATREIEFAAIHKGTAYAIAEGDYTPPPFISVEVRERSGLFSTTRTDIVDYKPSDEPSKRCVYSATTQHILGFTTSGKLQTALCGSPELIKLNAMIGPEYKVSP